MQLIRSILGVGLVVGLVGMVWADRELAWFAWLVIPGGLLIAGAMMILRRTRPGAPLLTVPDPMRLMGQSTDIINVSGIRVAGLGGLGLMVVSLAMMVTFPRIAWSVGAGGGLGVVWALLVIGYRRRHGPLVTGHGASRGRGVLFE